MNILLVDDHAVLREALAERLQREASISVVGTASDAAEAIEACRQEQPDVVVMDIDMPGLNCFDAARRILSTQPGIRIVFLSAHTNDNYIEQAIDVGAVGYLTKSEPPDTVIEAVREAAAGRVYFSPEIMSRMVVGDGQVGLASDHGARMSTLSQREMEVLQYIAQGHKKKEIAQVMKLSMKTVEKHTENLMRKLDIHDRVQLARFAIREGLVPA